MLALHQKPSGHVEQPTSVETPHGVVRYFPGAHCEQGVHVVSCDIVQTSVRYVFAAHALHGVHTTFCVRLHGVDMNVAGGAQVPHAVHAVSVVLVHSADV